MSYKIIVTDLDGTLLNTEKDISPRTLTTLQKAADKGVLFVPATGRFLAGLPSVVRSLPFLQYAIAINGAEIYNVPQNKLLHSDSISACQASQIFDYLDTLSIIYDCYRDNTAPMDARFYENIDTFIPDPHIAKMIKATRTPVHDFYKTVLADGHSFQKIQLFFKDMALREKVMAELPQMFQDISVTTSISNNIEINTKNANKGYALQVLCQILNIDIKDTIAFGDGGNDISLLQAAGLGIAMENACDEAKNAAKEITLSNDADGVAAAIEKIIL